MPALIDRTVQAVEQRQGPEAAADMRDRLTVAIGGGERVAADDGVTSLTGADTTAIETVLRVLGPASVAETLEAARAALPRLAARLALGEAMGVDMTRPHALLRRSQALVQEAEAARDRGDPVHALQKATTASSLLEAATQLIVRLDRLPTLEESVAAALREARQQDGDGQMRGLLVGYDSLLSAAAAALQHRDRDAAYRALQALRAERVRLVIQLRGPVAVRELVTALDRRLALVQNSLAAAREQQPGRDLVALEQMARTADELELRARRALQRGDAATALDLGSHVAGIVNTLFNELASY